MAWQRRLTAVVCVLAGAAVVASPYMWVTGKLVQKKSVLRFLESSEPTAARHGSAMLCDGHIGGDEGKGSDVPARSAGRAGLAGDVPRAVLLVAEKWVRSLRGTYLLPIVAWLFLRKRFPADRMGLRIVQAAAGLHLLILIALIVQFDYWQLFSLRHVMVLAGLSLPFAAAGIIALVESLPEPRQGVVVVLLGVGLIAPTLPWMLEARHREDAHFRSAARWMSDNTAHTPRVLTERFRMAFYAQADYIPAPLAADAGEYLARARQSNPDWIAFDERRILKESPDFFDRVHGLLLTGETLELARVEKNRLRNTERRVLVYRYRHAPPN